LQFLTVLPYGERKQSANGLRTLEHATCNCPYEKHYSSWCFPHTSKDCPWDLLIDIANARLTRNWSHLNSKAKSVGIILILLWGKYRICPLGLYYSYIKLDLKLIYSYEMYLR
jgi:hypothetical protein